MTADAILNLLCNETAGLIVHPKVIEKHLRDELPFLATEHILMEAVKRGKDRQVVHEKLRVHSHESSQKIKEEGSACDLLERLAQDKEIGLTKAEIAELSHVKHFIGRAVEQTHEFLKEEVSPLLHKHKEISPFIAEIKL